MSSVPHLDRPARKRAVGAWQGVRVGRPPTDGGTGAVDDAVLALVAEPFDSVADAHERLSALEAHFHERGDRRGAFLAIYARVTAAVGAAIDDGLFADPEWVTDYLVAFADLYRRALYAYETGDLDRVPDPWQLAFDAAGRGECMVSQAAVLGINAHVNYDLALALDTVGIGPDRRRRYDDHCAVNRVLASLVDEVQDALATRYAPGVADVDDRLGRLDEAVGFFTLREGRDSAWRSAVALNSRFSARRRFARWTLRTASTGAAYAILSPTRSGFLRKRLVAMEAGE